MTSFWDRPDAQAALAARAMDRAPLYEAMADADIDTLSADGAQEPYPRVSRWSCFQCAEVYPISHLRPIRDSRNHSSYICDSCSEANRRRYEEEYGTEPLATWQAEGR